MEDDSGDMDIESAERKLLASKSLMVVYNPPSLSGFILPPGEATCASIVSLVARLLAVFSLYRYRISGQIKGFLALKVGDN